MPPPQALLAGGIVGMPTETVYGLAVLPLAEPLDALIEAKRRPCEKGIALLIDGLDQVDPLVAGRRRPRGGSRRASGPAPLTLVLPLRPGVELPDAAHRRPRTRSACAFPTIAVPASDGAPPRPARGQLRQPQRRAGGAHGGRAGGVGRRLARVVLDDGPVRGGVVDRRRLSRPTAR